MGAPFPLIMPQRRTLAFPGWTPSLPLNHPAAKGGVLFSAVPAGANMISIGRGIGGAKGTPTGVTAGIDGILGPYAHVAAGSNQIRFTGVESSSNTDAGSTGATFGMIFIPDGNTNGTFFFCASSAQAAALVCDIEVGNSIQVRLSAGNNINTGLLATVGSPYFFAGSLYATGGNLLGNMVLRSLTTGAIQTFSNSTALSGIQTTDGGNSIGSRNGSGAAGAKYAAVMYSNGFCNLPTLLAWAADPWSFWYPTDPLAQMWPAAPAAPVVSGLPHGLHFHATMGALKSF